MLIIFLVLISRHSENGIIFYYQNKIGFRDSTDWTRGVRPIMFGDNKKSFLSSLPIQEIFGGRLLMLLLIPLCRQISWHIFLKGPFLFIFNNFYRKIVDSSGIRTRIVRVEGEHADHLTTTRAKRHVL